MGKKKLLRRALTGLLRSFLCVAPTEWSGNQVLPGSRKSETGWQAALVRENRRIYVRINIHCQCVPQSPYGVTNPRLKECMMLGVRILCHSAWAQILAP
jgi:hypothetical protein